MFATYVYTSTEQDYRKAFDKLIRHDVETYLNWEVSSTWHSYSEKSQILISHKPFACRQKMSELGG